MVDAREEGGHVQRIYVVGTADTKGEELAHIAGLVRQAGATPCVVDVGIRNADVPVDVTAREVAGGRAGSVFIDDRGAAVANMATAFAEFMAARTDVAGVLGIGGSGGTSIVSAGMRRLPGCTPRQSTV